jgi:RDD family/Protein of unknown function (DUF1614)
VIDLGQLTSDIVGNAVSVALPGILWAAIFLLAFEHGSFSASIGLSRRTFWLLLPGAIASTFGNLPLFPVGDDIVGIGLSGALFSILVGLLAFRAFAPPERRSLGLFAVGYAVLAAAGLGVVLAVRSTVAIDLGVLAVLAAVPLGIGLLSPRPNPTIRPVAFLFGLLGGVAFLTFLFSEAIPGVGITEGFPQYLAPPILAGAIGALAAPLAFRGREALVLPVAFVAGTFGVLLGADILRQPPLYTGATSGLYVIGGAGVFDLVYLSGLLALAVALFAHRLLGRGWTPVGDFAPSRPSPIGRLARSFRSGVRGDLNGSLQESLLATREAAAQTHELYGIAAAPPDRPWQGLPLPGWAFADQANLAASAAAGTTDGRESFRGWLTARYLVQYSNQLNTRRFASAYHRSVAYGIDLLILTVPAFLFLGYLAATIPGGYSGVAGSVAYNAAIYGFISVGFLYFVVSERLWGTTPGKWLEGLEVRERGMRAPTLLPVLVRNSFRVPTLSILGIGAGIVAEFVFVHASPTPVSFGGLFITLGLLNAVFFAIFVILGVGLLGVFGYLAILATAERQRCGDLLAGTWVVRRATPVRPAQAVPVAAPTPRPAAPGSSG